MDSLQDVSHSLQLLPFQREILDTIHDPVSSDLVLLARGLGLRSIICTLLKIYDSPSNLVLMVNAGSDEELAIGEQLGVMGCRKPGLRIVGYEMAKRERNELYKKGGLMSVTSRILVVDMLQSDIATELITGLVVLHAERVTSLSLEAFIIRLFREKNTQGFVKAFSDQPETITSGLYPLKSIMKELQLRKVHFYPRFHASIKASLERRKADVVELYQPLSNNMTAIHEALVQCTTTTLAELKRANKELDLDDITTESAYFRSFDGLVRRMLDPVWHRVGPKTRQLVGDLAVLRRLLSYLLTYDSLAFHAYLETVIASNSTNAAGNTRQHQSQWLFTDAANIVFRMAKQRCYLNTRSSRTNPGRSSVTPAINQGFDEDEDAWAVLDELEGGMTNGGQTIGKSGERRPRWLPGGLEPQLEELPKWSLLAEVLEEVEQEILRMESQRNIASAAAPGTYTTLVMVSSPRTADVLRDFLSTRDASKPRGEQGRKMMLRRLRNYLWWKGKLNDQSKDGRRMFGLPDPKPQTPDIGIRAQGNGRVAGEALKKKDSAILQRSMNRRRMRGGTPASAARSSGSGLGDTAEAMADSIAKVTSMGARERENLGILAGEGEMRLEADTIADFIASQQVHILDNDDDTPDAMVHFISDTVFDTYDHAEYDANYGLLAPAETILIRTYADDTDDMVLAEIRPRFIVMYEPNQDFIRRIECYRSANPGLGVRVYFMVYHLSTEEHKYLVGLRREKDAFERLIKERASMVLVLGEDRNAVRSSGDNIIKAISTRFAGGREVNLEPSRVIVDMREFRSTLPSLLHASKLLVVPATLTVGDYVLTPEIVVERKSIPDLVSSFNSGRLYTQCELMSVHYKQPVLLIEFEEHKSFSLETVADIKSYVKPTGKYPIKKKAPAESDSAAIVATSVQSKLVLLTLSFPRLRIIWSSSPYATAEIFNDLKTHNLEPDAAHAVGIGAEEDPEAGAGVNAAAEELLRSLPGVTAKNVKYVMSKVGSVREFCELELVAVQEILGVEPGKACWEFMHHGEGQRR